MNQINKIALSLTALTTSFLSVSASALPSYKRLWERKYGYSTSCTLCHSKGGGSQVNSYGEDFQRFGMTAAAFATIEKRDSDKDSFPNIDEISAKANPGESTSTPKALTDWLSRIEESMLPLPELKKIFPGTKKFSSLEGTLYPEQAKAVETAITKKLLETDSVPTFYFAVDDQKSGPVRVGVALFSTPNENSEKLIVGVGVDLTGKIKNVTLIKNKLGKGLADQKFLSQFKDKTAASPLKLNSDIQMASADLKTESDQVIETVKKSLLIIQAVFTKGKK